jgi:hypothetical protein
MEYIIILRGDLKSGTKTREGHLSGCKCGFNKERVFLLDA